MTKQLFVTYKCLVLSISFLTLVVCTMNNYNRVLYTQLNQKPLLSPDLSSFLHSSSSVLHGDPYAFICKSLLRSQRLLGVKGKYFLNPTLQLCF